MNVRLTVILNKITIKRKYDLDILCSAFVWIVFCDEVMMVWIWDWGSFNFLTYSNFWGHLSIFFASKHSNYLFIVFL